MTLLFMAAFCFQANTASALDDVNFCFYYQSIEGVKQINEPITEDDSLWTKIKKTGKKAVNWVASGWENAITRNFALGDGGESTWYSGKDPNIAYNVKRTKVTSEAELLAAMGAKSESELSNGQKALLASFRTAYSDAMKSRADASFRSSVNVILTDTTGYDDEKKYPNVRSDFWPYSSGFTIQMSSNCYNYPGGEEDASSTMIHEYSHSMDLTLKELINPYGLDGSHYGNEVTGKRSAFVEAWAEYNEMIESEKEAMGIIKNTQKLVVESKTVAGSYSVLLPEDATSEQLMAAESYLALLLYRLSQNLDDGEAKITEAFTDTRWKIWRTMPTLIQKLIKNNPEDAAKIVATVDEVFLGKLSDDELLDYCGKSDAVKAYIATRGQAKDADVEMTEEIKATASEKPLEVEAESDSPFSVR